EEARKQAREEAAKKAEARKQAQEEAAKKAEARKQAQEEIAESTEITEDKERTSEKLLKGLQGLKDRRITRKEVQDKVESTENK
ncbi:MAG: hypothetical protein ACFFCZ_23325, partial [Promethearchaeota archaeon]